MLRASLQTVDLRCCGRAKCASAATSIERAAHDVAWTGHVAVVGVEEVSYLMRPENDRRSEREGLTDHIAVVSTGSVVVCDASHTVAACGIRQVTPREKREDIVGYRGLVVPVVSSLGENCVRIRWDRIRVGDVRLNIKPRDFEVEIELCSVDRFGSSEHRQNIVLYHDCV